MGSSGYGSFGDLKKSPNNDLCKKAIEGVELEEVARSEYYSELNEVPPFMHLIEVKRELVNGRVVVISSENQIIIGNLPSKYSYLLACMKQGISYMGTVTYSVVNPIPRVMVDLNAE
ncbi:hypothetical protein KB559_15870 [Paenibacillus sp. Marseille-P2973]|uniref:hypothetical protein n=1 Tax=Paenibacillus sp. Marseille-P2973 TaxID=1871032 RepID=UPI001B37732E|nr:hypothetical protein [Paenibacillus sp. Marseille-P2973]MBQ4900314.1 hypothetical protein [Paenibacillus sp. Marseille-P2973]